ncbi:MAG: adenylate/guanylate cyclase domain-containing protein [Ilumatobacteraceae bacterium]
MAYVDELTADVNDIVKSNLENRKGTVVPTTDSVTMTQSVTVDATYLFADLAGSSTAAAKLKKPVTAAIIRGFLRAASSIIRKQGGEIRSYDGDRVMGIFMGDGKNSDAAKAGLQINWAVGNILRPALKAKWANIEDFYVLDHGVGIATGESLIVKGGVHGNNDLASIGQAPNIAAKLSDRRSAYKTYITAEVYGKLNEKSKYGGDPKRDMWTALNNVTIGEKVISVYGSTWSWKP